MTENQVETQARLGDLPERHLAALRAALAGFTDRDIAGLLGIPIESVPTTLQLAAAKLVRVLSGAGPSEGGFDGSRQVGDDRPPD